MIIYILGIITGILFTIIFIFIILQNRIVIERVSRQMQSKFKQKGKIIEPDNEQLRTFIENLPDE